MAEGSNDPLQRRPSLKPASFQSRSTLSLSGDDASSRTSTNSGEVSPRQGSPISRRYKQRKSSAGASSTASGPPNSTAGTFLSRFIGNFRSSGSLEAPRPHLARSLSSPGLQSTSRDQLPPAVPPIPGAFPSPSSQGSSTSTLQKFRPSFTRRATTNGGAPSPRASPAHSPVLSIDVPRGSPGSPATLRGRERDPMEVAFGGARAGHAPSGSTDSRIESPGFRSMRRGSAVSQTTLQPEPGVRTPGLEAIEEPGAPIPLERPLELIATLLPPALLLLSQLGPSHLFSPPLIHPLLGNTSLGRSTSSGDSNAQAFSDRASITSTTSSNATSSTFPLLPSTNLITHAYSHELHAPSTLSVPAVSAAAVWRLFRGFEWIGEFGGEAKVPTSGESSAEIDAAAESSSFDFPSLLQGVADALAADAGARGVELVIGQVGSGSAPSPVSTPDATEAALPKQEKVSESRELLVRGDERAWSVVLIWILHHIIASAVPGATVEVRFLATAVEDSSIPEMEEESTESEEAPTPTSAEKRWAVSLEILHTYAPAPSSPYSAPSPPCDMPSPPFSTPFARSLLAHLPLEVTQSADQSVSRSWVLKTELPSCKAKPLQDDPSTLLGRRRASLESTVGQEPTMNDLKRFAEVALKGQNVALHSGENSTFAKHLTTYLAGWGMDVSHVPLDSEEATGAGSESMWNKGRREPLARVDSGFATEGHSPMSPFAEPHVSPLANLTAESVASSTTSSDAPSDLIIIDDDIATLRRILSSLRAAPPQYHASLMAKRPQLATRRTRSSPHVRQLHQIPHVTSASVIIHFASLTHYKSIKDIVQNTLASSKTASLPEVLVIPKPAGPRRIITALWTALKRPAVDPSLPPIATSPTSPGVQYWTPRLSPAIAKEQEFDFHGSDTSASGREPSSSHSNKPRTPPAASPFYGNAAVAAPAGHPPSPLGKLSDDQASYFSVVAEGIDGTTPSEGMVIQSPDGRPAIFFQPQTRSSRAERAKDKAARIERSLSQRSSDGGESSPPATRPPMATPHEIGLGAVRRLSSPSSSSSGEVVGTPALALDSFITAAKSRAVGEEPVESEATPLSGGTTLVRQQSTASIISRSSSAKAAVGSATSSPRVGASSPAFVARRMTSSSGGASGPSSPVANSPHLSGQGTPTTRQREASAPSSPPFLQSRRGTMSFGKKPRKPSRKPTLATVPPINVLIVEDNPINQTILSMFMKKKGIKYAVAKDGEEAVQKWKSGGFHLVLMDIQLPVKSGIEATQEIRDMERANNIGTFITTPTTDPSSPISFGSSSSSSGANSAMSSVVNSPISPPLSMPVIIVALTASSLQVDRVSALAAGCNDFLTKPVSLPWLQQKLLEWGSMAYLSGFSLLRSDSPTSAAPPITTVRHTQTTHAGFTAGLNSKAENISAHLHIDPRHDRSTPGRNGSPSRVGPPTQLASTVRAIEAAADANSEMNPPSPLSLASNPSVTISSPTPIVTPHAPPVPPAPTGPPASFEADLRTIKTPEGVSQPADLEAVDDQLESIAAQRPGPSPLSNSTSISDLHLESVVAEGARLADATRSRASSAGNSFSQVMHESGTVSSRNSPEEERRGFDGAEREGSDTP